MQIIYADLLFLTDFAANALSLLASARVCASPVRYFRLFSAAALGGLYSVAVFVPGLEFLSFPIIKIVFGVIMALITFGAGAGFLRRTAAFFAAAMLFGGAACALTLSSGERRISTPALLAILAAACCCVSLFFGRSGRKSGRIVSLSVRLGGREISLRAMTDTGNSLSDPITCDRAAVVWLEDARPLFPPETFSLLTGLHSGGVPDVLEKLSQSPSAVRFRILPYRAIGTECGMLIAFRPDEVYIDGKRKTGMIVALSPAPLTDGGPFSAIIGSEED